MALSTDVIDKIQENAASLRMYDFSEADTVSHLVDPVLDYLGYTVAHQRREGQIKKNRPDIAIWEEPLHIASGLPANAIIEAKPLGTDLNGNGKAKQERPKEQIARYVTGFERSSLDTLGLLTDGNVWHIVRPVENSRRVELVDEMRLLDSAPRDAARNLEEIRRLLHAARRPTLSKTASATKDARALANAMAEGMSASDILLRLVGTADYSSDLDGQVNLQGKAEQAEAAYWESYAYATAGRIRTDRADLNHEAVCVAVVRMAKAESENDYAIYREDVATAAAAFAKTVPVRMSIVFVIQPDEGGNPVNARVAVHHQGHTGMTAEFDPYTPSPLILRSIQRIYDQLKRKTPVLANDIASSVAAKGVRKEFYKAVADGWTLRQYRKAKGSAKARRRHKEAALRHLIRTLFAWILKEEGKLPQEAFDRVFVDRHAPGSYHDQILTFMFHERLNKPENMRRRHPRAEIEFALSGTRFLNGSLFARHEHDDEFHLDDEEYFGTNPKRPGLFTILSGYEWTTSEHTPVHSDQTIDPEVLSNLFENLIAATETDDTPDRMPKGAYYTPADVAAEMVKDALTLSVRDYAPAGWTESDLLDLFEDSETAPPTCTRIQRSALVRRIKELTMFDPSVGSGVFPLSFIYAVRGALAKLGESDANGGLTRSIIGKQIYAQDISPMAAQITRLRLFVAIIAVEDDAPKPLPLPNLEAKIVCADTLSTVPRRGWSVATTGGLQDVDAGITGALSELAAIRARWQNAHEESDKLRLRREDEEARARLGRATKAGISGRETRAFADHPLLEPDAPPAQIDARLLFYQENWTGFDIVIGNPPYEIIAKGRTPAARKAVKAQLKDRGYTTVGCNNLYALIAEAGLTLAKPDGGILTLIVPLSLCFGQNKKPLRALIERASGEIRLRSHDNRPEPVFKESPVSHSENRQRATILTAVMATESSKPDILVTGTNKWLRSERHLFLQHRSYSRKPIRARSIDSRIDRQWERIPTDEVAVLIDRMRECALRVRDLAPPPPPPPAGG